MNRPPAKYDVIYGQGCSSQLVELAKSRRVLLVTDELLWSKYGTIFSVLKPQIVMTRTMESSSLEKEHARLDDFDLAIGLGGGMALDIAKYHAWMSSKPVYQVPTAISVDAMFLYPIALRIDGKVKYVDAIFLGLTVIVGGTAGGYLIEHHSAMTMLSACMASSSLALLLLFFGKRFDAYHYTE